MRASTVGIVLSLGLVGCPAPVVPKEEPPPPKPTAEPPPPPVASPEAVVEIASFRDHHCVLRASGAVDCWGKNTYGQLGDGTREDQALPARVAGVDDAVHVATGRDFSCVVRGGGTVACWGNNEDGQLGNGRGVEPGAREPAPVEVEGLVDVTELTLGEYHGCALHGGGRVSCWGNTADGQAGSSETRALSRPNPIDKLGPVKQIAAGASHVCAVEKKGTVRCWGRNTEGQLGAEVTGSRANSVAVEGLHGVTRIASGHLHACAVGRGGRVSCWGDNKAHQLGPEAGDDGRRKRPVAVPGLAEIVDIAAGGGHTCARDQAGALSCWGDNASGQLGHAAGEPSAAPRGSEVKGVLRMQLGSQSTCVVLQGGTAKCWGAVTMDL
jgi:alpha-tubulin suppressor-like RCC1 family protein